MEGDKEEKTTPNSPTGDGDISKGDQAGDFINNSFGGGSGGEEEEEEEYEDVYNPTRNNEDFTPLPELDIKTASVMFKNVPLLTRKNWNFWHISLSNTLDILGYEHILDEQFANIESQNIQILAFFTINRIKDHGLKIRINREKSVYQIVNILAEVFELDNLFNRIHTKDKIIDFQIKNREEIENAEERFLLLLDEFNEISNKLIPDMELIVTVVVPIDIFTKKKIGKN